MKLESVETDNQMTGYLFYCPGCGDAHYLTVRPHVAQNGASWEFNGNLEKPTFRPSVLQRIEYKPESGKKTSVCHSYVTDGEIQFLNDCTHALAGLTVELPEVEAS